MLRVSIALVALIPSISLAAPKPFPQFKTQEIDKTLKVGYGLRIVDLNQDGKLDVVVADSARVIWFDQAQDWKLRTIIENAKTGVKPDNVCLDVADIDGDGKLDVALGADWQINNTAAGGSLQWLRQGGSIDEWSVHKIADSIPTLHRIHFAKLGGEAKPNLLVGPIRGVGSTQRENYMDKPLRLLSYAVPDDARGAWAEPRVLVESLHHMHNFTPLDVDGDNAPDILTASAEGVGMLRRGGGDGMWTWVQLGAGSQPDPAGGRGGGARGSSEVKSLTVQGRPAFVAAIEPLHGHQVVTYQFANRPADQPPPPPPGSVRTVVDDQLKGGHALWCADLDGDGTDEIVAGFRDATERGVAPGVNVYRMAGDADTPTWEKHVLDPKGMACEDLACADLNGDGKVDVVAAGRATGNVRIYWNQGVQGR